MKFKPGLKTIRLLMMAAQLMLVAFVGHWLNMQYREEVNNLEKLTHNSFLEAKQQVYDTLIMTSLINPVMDSVHYKFDFQFNADSMPQMLKDFSPINCSTTSKGVLRANTVVIQVRDSASPVKNKISRKLARVDGYEGNMVLQGVKLFIHKAKAFDGADILADSLTRNADTGFLKQVYKDNLNSISPILEPTWTVSRIESSKNDVEQLQNVFLFKDQVLTAGVSNVLKYVFLRIYPQVLFAILLLLLTALSFILAFRTLKSQIKLNSLRNEFVSNISHELKTPVATVKVALEALHGFNVIHDPVKSSEYLGMATHEINRLELLVNKVLATSALESSSQLMANNAVDIAQLVQDVIISLQPQIQSLNAEVKLEVKGENALVKGDQFHLQGVIINLLDNSLKYTVAVPHIDIKIDTNDSKVILTFSDNGIGIPKEYHKKVFIRFFRVPTDLRHNVKGHGLGLSYAAMVMQLHGASIEAFNNIGGGTIIKLVFNKLSG
jgi:signal transduction histidine kinase